MLTRYEKRARICWGFCLALVVCIIHCNSACQHVMHKLLRHNLWKEPKQNKALVWKVCLQCAAKMKMCALCGENLSHLLQDHKDRVERVKVPNWYSLETHCSLPVSFLRYSWESLKTLIYSNCIILAGFIWFLFNWIFSLRVKLALVLNPRIQKSISHVPAQAPAKPLGDLDSIDFLPHIQSYNSLHMMILHIDNSLIILANYLLKGQEPLQMHILPFTQ